MKNFLTRVAGLVLIIGGIAGLIVSIAAIVALIRSGPQVEAAAMELVERIDQALATTAEGLALAESSISQAADTLVSTAEIAAGAGQTVNGVVPTIDVVSDLLAEELPTTIDSTQEALTSAATSAKLIDD